MKEKTTNYPENPLWQKLAELPFEDGFIQRLARENEWGVLFAKQVIGEYRKFLYLTQVAGHPVTPSKAVDEAWHLHLLYTRSYWEGLCDEVLGKPLHHEPGSGKASDRVHFAEQYQQTQESYRAVFGTEPPTAVWGTPKPKPTRTLTRKRTLGWLATVLGSAAMIGASGGELVVALVCLGLVGVIIASVVSYRKYPTTRGSSDLGTDGSSCGGFFVASSCGTSDSGGDSGGGDGGGSGCGSSCGGGGCGGGGD